MAEALFDRARVGLCDSAYMNRQTSLGGLQSLGFANVTPYARIDQVAEALQYDCFDLIIADLKDQEAQVFDFVRQVRARRIGANPFAVILLTTWDLNQETVRQVISSGADDLLGRPFSIKQLKQRVLGAASQRKQFVVTCDYLGPSRRVAQRQDQDAMFDAPNTLKAQLMGRAAIGAADIERSWRQVQLWRLYRFGERLQAILAKLEPLKAGAHVSPEMAKLVRVLEICAAQLEAEAARTGLAGADRLVAYASVLKRMAPKLLAPPQAGETDDTWRVIVEVINHICERTEPMRPSPEAPGEGAQTMQSVAVVN